jgi:hypothetical protein
MTAAEGEAQESVAAAWRSLQTSFEPEEVDKFYIFPEAKQNQVYN